MAVLTETELTNLVLDRLQANTATDAPFTAAQIRRHLNEAYVDLWEIEGGGVKVVAGGTAWATQPTTDAKGNVAGSLTDINEVRSVWASLTSASLGRESGDIELDIRKREEVQWMRNNAIGSYGTPKICSITRLATTVPADVNKMQLDVWPAFVDYYYPIEYVPQFSPLTDSITTPDLTDVGSRDMGLLAAARMAPLISREHLVDDILRDVSQRTTEALERKMLAMMSGDQDN